MGFFNTMRGAVAGAFLMLASFGAADFVDASTLDQNNDTVGGGFCLTSGSNLCGQSFKQSGSNISGAGIFLTDYNISLTAPLILSVYSNFSATFNGLIATGTIGLASSGWNDVFWAATNLVGGQTYFLTVSSGNVSFIWTNDNGGNYGDGNAFYSSYSSSYFSNQDLTFRTYTALAPVPVPAALPLLVGGLVLFGFVGHRRKKTVTI